MNDIWSALKPPSAAPLPDKDTVITQWKEMQAELRRVAAAELGLRQLAIALNFPAGIAEGTNNLELGKGYVLKATGCLNYTLDKDKVEDALDTIEKLGPEGAFVAERLVKWEPKLSIGEYRKLPESYKKTIDGVLTIKPGTPQLELVEPKVKG